VLAQTRAPAAGAFEPEYEPARLDEVLSPVLQLGIASRGRGDRELCEQLPDLVERDRVVALLVGVDPDCDHRLLPIVGDVEAVGQSCVE